jgi:hypothetical protein
MRQTATPAPRSLWIARPWLDLVVGCGGWSLPLLAVAYLLTGDAARAWSSSFYLLALGVNYPHYMATIYRAYGRGEWRRHVPYSVWGTLLLVGAGAAAHVVSPLVPLLFSAYVMWSPWHYSGQNYGLAIMFARRGGLTITPRQQQWLKLSFVGSYLMLLASFNNGPSADPLVLSAALPAGAVRAITVVCAVLFIAGYAIVGTAIIRQRQVRAAVPVLTLLGTQTMWFVAPIVISALTGTAAPQTRYSSGVLAMMHSAQYLWITQYFARREQGSAWSGTAYWLAVTLGGIALFLPVPWLASSVAGVDFTVSMLIVTAIVNLHHFMMDGVVWKLRDPRVAAKLTSDATAADAPHTRWIDGPAHRAAIAVAAILLIALAGVDQWRYRLASREADADALRQALALNPYDAAARSRLLNALMETGRYDDARSELDRAMALYPGDSNHRVNAGVLARRTGRLDAAIVHWEQAIAINPAQPPVQLYLAEALHEQGRAADAVPHYQAFLESLLAVPDSARRNPETAARVILKFGDALEQSGRAADARSQFELATAIADRAGLSDLASEARARQANAR